jgi:hypothetical protein
MSKYNLPQPPPQPKREEKPQTDRRFDPRTVRPLGPEDMTESEIDELMANRQPKDRAEWGRNEFGDKRPLSAWDHV